MDPHKMRIFEFLSVLHAIDISEEYAGAMVFSIDYALGFIYHGVSCVGRGWASTSNPTSRRGLSEWKGGLAPWNEFPRPFDSGRWTRHLQGRAQAEMVLVTFAETKVTRRAGTKPR